MEITNIHQAKTHLSKLIERALQGEEIIIAKAGKPVVKLIPYEPNTTYRFRIVIDGPQHTYSAYVAIPGEPESVIANNYRFRTTQNTVEVAAATLPMAEKSIEL